jgi:hypothetical protein
MLFLWAAPKKFEKFIVIAFCCAYAGTDAIHRERAKRKTKALSHAEPFM